MYRSENTDFGPAAAEVHTSYLPCSIVLDDTTNKKHEKYIINSIILSR